MRLRFRRSIRLIPGIRLNLSKSGVSASVGRRGAWLARGPRGARATVGIPGTGLSWTEQSAWARTKPHLQTSAPPAVPGIEVTELPRVEIEIPPVRDATPTPTVDDDVGDDVVNADPRLLPIVLVIAALIAAAAVIWALVI
jgi:Protein of unknown function (DUF4236)